MTAADAQLMDRPEAIAIARAFVAALDGTYETLVVAGSLRRRLATIGDIEIVCVPKIELLTEGLFEDMPVSIDRVDNRMMALLDNAELTKRRDRNGAPRWGPTLKYAEYQGARIDLFTPCIERLGWILTLRTGPAAFSRQLVVPRGRRTRDGRAGLLPPLVMPRDGWLTWRVSGERIETRDERAVFELLQIPYQDPWSRL